MKAAVFYGPGDLRIEEVRDPDPGPGELLVEVRAAATCGTDVKSYRRGHPKLFPELPSLFGHEFAGVVLKAGRGTIGFDVGARVVAANTAPCGTCWACTIGRESQCERLTFLNGAFAERIRVPAPIASRNTFHLPDHVPFRDAALLEPLATVVHGISEAGIRLGDTVAIHGAGPIGLMFARLAKLRGARVISVERSEDRLRSAARMGADDLVNVARVGSPEEGAALVRAVTRGCRGADVAIEAAGYPEVWEQAIRSLRPGGTCVLFGGPQPGRTVPLDASAMHYQEYTLKGVFHHTPDCVRRAFELIVSGQVDASELITADRPLERLVESLEDMEAGRGEKYVVVPQGAVLK